MGVRGIIWDLDGVLLDSEGYHIEAEIQTVKKFGFHITPAITKEYLGVRLDEYFRDLVRRFHPQERMEGGLHASLCNPEGFENAAGSEFHVEEMIGEHRKTLRRYYQEIIPLMPHSREVLAKLKDRYQMGIATSRERELASIALVRFHLLQFFTAIVYGDDVSCGKPDPEVFLTAARNLGVRPPEAVVIEDSAIGLKAARNGGFLLVAFRAAHNSDVDFSFADAVVEDLREVPQCIERIFT
jgi:beta-phosphoglucomutase